MGAETNHHQGKPGFGQEFGLLQAVLASSSVPVEQENEGPILSAINEPGSQFFPIVCGDSERLDLPPSNGGYGFGKWRPMTSRAPISNAIR